MSSKSPKTGAPVSQAAKNRSFIYNLVLISISAALITVFSWISIPAGPVPFTLQTLAILAVMLTCGGKRGTLAILVYLALGACGLPVFAGFKGGIASFLGPTGGFLIGFVLAGLVYWLLESLIFKRFITGTVKTYVAGILNSLVFEIVMYITGVIWFMSVYAAQTKPVTLATVMTLCVFPFLIPDAVKLVIAVIIGERTRKLVRA